MAGSFTHWGEINSELRYGSKGPKSVEQVTGQKIKALPSIAAKLVHVGSSSAADAEEETVSMPSTDFFHSLQLHIFLRRAASGQSNPLPILKVDPKLPVSGTRVELSRTDAISVIRKAVILLCVDCGYDEATDSCLDLLTEACSRFVHRICTHISSHHESQQLTTTNDMEYLYQLLDEIGFPIASLHHFAKSQTDRKHERLLRINRMYGHISDPNPRPTAPISGQVIRDLSGMICGLEEDAVPADERKVWDQSLDQLSQMTDEEILQSLTGD